MGILLNIKILGIYLIIKVGIVMINKIGKITLYVNNQEDAKLFWTEN